MLRSDGFGCPVYVMDSAGGVMSAEHAARRPIFTIESGGAAGVVAAGQLGSRYDLERVLSFDMGGTTAKAGLVRDGAADASPITSRSAARAASASCAPDPGLPVKTPVVDLAEVGAGGGSIAWVDGTGALRVGPRSAGADPGPACYGRGGTEPTVTDANLVLGYLDPAGLADGVHLDVAAAEKALNTRVAVPLGMSGPVEAARAVRDIAVATMAAAIRVVTVQRGEDPREAVMVAFGGAGPMFAVDLARVFGMSRIVVPAAAGVGSAAGLLHADLSVEQLRTRVLAADGGQFPSSRSHFRRADSGRARGDRPGSGTRRVALRHRHALPRAGPPAAGAALRAGPRRGPGARAGRVPRGVRERVRGGAGAARRVRHLPRAGDLPVRRGRDAVDAAPRLGARGRRKPPVPGGRRSRAEDGFVDVPVYRARRSAQPGTGFRARRSSRARRAPHCVPPGALLTVDALGTMHLWPDGKDLA